LSPGLNSRLRLKRESYRHQIVDPQLDIDYYEDFEAPQGYYTDTPNKIALLSLDWAGLDPEEL
jgi:hypothetical protein